MATKSARLDPSRFHVLLRGPLRGASESAASSSTSRIRCPLDDRRERIRPGGRGSRILHDPYGAAIGVLDLRDLAAGPDLAYVLHQFGAGVEEPLQAGLDVLHRPVGDRTAAGAVRIEADLEIAGP